MTVSIIGKYVEFIYCVCGCKKTRPRYTKDGIEARYIWKHPLNDQYGEKNPYYKNGSYIDHKGYRMILARDHRSHVKGYVREHRYLFEKYHKCCLLPWGDVHHNNRNPKDNSKKNLEGMMHYKHPSIHNKKDMSNRFCAICGSTKTQVYKKSYAMWCNYKDGHICHKCYKKIRKGIN